MSDEIKAATEFTIPADLISDAVDLLYESADFCGNFEVRKRCRAMALKLRQAMGDTVTAGEDP